MRVLARIGCTLAGLALAAPATVLAQPPAVLTKPWAAGPHRAKKAAKGVKGAVAAVSPREQDLCNDCQRALIKKRDGIDVPPPPPYPEGSMLVIGDCPSCKGPVLGVRQGATPISGGQPSRNRGQGAAGFVVMGDESAPGRAVVGGGGPMVAGGDPAPIGMYRGRPAPPSGLATASTPAMPGSRDASVMPSSMTTPATDPVSPLAHKRPKVLSHLFGFSDIGRERAEERERRNREGHAKIPYGQQTQQMSELPADLVFGKGR